jgi:hypothetical protein
MPPAASSGDTPLAGCQCVEPGKDGATGPGASSLQLGLCPLGQPGSAAAVCQVQSRSQRLACGGPLVGAPQCRAELHQRMRVLQPRIGPGKHVDSLLQASQALLAPLE